MKIIKYILIFFLIILIIYFASKKLKEHLTSLEAEYTYASFINKKIDASVRLLKYIKNYMYLPNLTENVYNYIIWLPLERFEYNGFSPTEGFSLVSEMWNGIKVYRLDKGANQKEGEGIEITIPPYTGTSAINQKNDFTVLWIYTTRIESKLLKVYRKNPDGTYKNFGIYTDSYSNATNIGPDGSSTDYWHPVPIELDSSRKILITNISSTIVKFVGFGFSTNPWNHCKVSDRTLYLNLNFNDNYSPNNLQSNVVTVSEEENNISAKEFKIPDELTEDVLRNHIFIRDTYKSTIQIEGVTKIQNYYNFGFGSSMVAKPFWIVPPFTNKNQTVLHPERLPQSKQNWYYPHDRAYTFRDPYGRLGSYSLGIFKSNEYINYTVTSLLNPNNAAALANYGILNKADTVNLNGDFSLENIYNTLIQIQSQMSWNKISIDNSGKNIPRQLTVNSRIYIEKPTRKKIVNTYLLMYQDKSKISTNLKYINQYNPGLNLFQWPNDPNYWSNMNLEWMNHIIGAINVTNSRLNDKYINIYTAMTHIEPITDDMLNTIKNNYTTDMIKYQPWSTNRFPNFYALDIFRNLYDAPNDTYIARVHYFYGRPKIYREVKNPILYIKNNSTATFRIPFVNSKKNKILYLVEYNSNWGPSVYNITVNNNNLGILYTTFDNPFSIHYNSKSGNKYLGLYIPKEILPLTDNFITITITTRDSQRGLYIREIGTHDQVPDV
jgi:hypothetical protein